MIFAALALGAGFWLTVPTTVYQRGDQSAVDRPIPALSGEKAIAHLKESGQYESLDGALTVARYEAEQADGIAVATNYANHMRATFTPEGLRIESFTDKVRWQSRWRLQTLGYGDQLLNGWRRRTGN